jgi:asparagine synthase (glutamine-hydrolysing)
MNSFQGTIRCVLGTNSRTRWSRAGAVAVRGYAFDPDTGAAIESAGLARHLAGSFADFLTNCERLQGCFAAVWFQDTEPGRCAAFVDQVRSIPLFFAVSEGILVISDDADHIARSAGLSPTDSLASLEFLLHRVTTGNATLVPGLLQLRAGESLQASDRRITLARYGPYATPGSPATDPASDPVEERRLLDEGVALVLETGDRLVRSIGDRPVAIPLSGGLDSRLIAFLLVRGGRRDALCFSYGTARSFDGRTSRQIAERLGMEWFFVPYSARRWDRWYRTSSYQEYRQFASQLHAIEHEQDWPAIRSLLEDGVLQPETIVVPGHTGDVVAGSQLPEACFERLASPDPIEWIWERHYRNLPRRHLSADWTRMLKDRIQAEVDTWFGSDMSLEDAVRAFDLFGRQERQAKMIVNSVRAYEQHGLGWRLPLWDPPFANFWLRVPPRLKRRKRLYRQIAEAVMGDVALIPYEPTASSPLLSRISLTLDREMHRHGMYLGPHPVLGSVTRRIGHLTRGLDDPWARELLGPLRRYPLQRISINGLLALHQLVDTRSRFGVID